MDCVIEDRPVSDQKMNYYGVQMAKANGVRWYGHLLRRDGGHHLRKVLEFEVKGKRKRGQPKKTWEDTSGERGQERWFGEKGCHESSEMV